MTQVKNINQLGRIFNMVQHPSIAAPFLSAETRVDCNGKRGFTQGPRGCAEVLWHAPREFPAAVTARDGVRDAHGMTGGADDVFSYEVDPKETYGWVTWQGGWSKCTSGGERGGALCSKDP